ncbi:TPA: hypothetical protein ACG3P3_001465 [Clostridioides difficile]
MKLTKEIEIINIYNEKVTIKPIDYDIALRTIILMEEQSLLTKKISKLFVKLYNEGITNIKENIEMKKILKLKDDMNIEEKELREKNDYWYCGIDNLDDNDTKGLIDKYKRRDGNICLKKLI